MSYPESNAARTRAAWRRRARGAALVEAALVLPVLCTFLGMMIWFHNIYKMKQDLILRARTDAFTSASHGCTNQGSVADTSASGALTGDAQGAANAGGTQEALSTHFNTAHGKAADTARGSGGTTGSWKKDMHYEAAVMCNERKNKAGLAGMVGFAMDVVKSKNLF